MNMETERVKRFVTVNADYMADGSICPRSVTLDGRIYRIDYVNKVEEDKTFTGERGRRCYHIVVHGKKTELYEKDERWFVKKKVVG